MRGIYSPRARARRVARTRERDDVPASQVQAIIAAQMPRHEKLYLADDVLENAGSLDDLETAVGELHARYLALARSFPEA